MWELESKMHLWVSKDFLPLLLRLSSYIKGPLVFSFAQKLGKQNQITEDQDLFQDTKCLQIGMSHLLGLVGAQVDKTVNSGSL
jgi:hypothetical protein